MLSSRATYTSERDLDALAQFNVAFGLLKANTERALLRDSALSGAKLVALLRLFPVNPKEVRTRHQTNQATA